MRSLWMALAAAVALTACGGDAGSITELDDSPSSIEVEIASGNVTIVGNASVGGTSIEATIRDGEPDPSYELAGGVLTISDRCDAATACRVDYVVSIAGDADVTVSTRSGNVALTDLTGAMTIDATDGDVTLATVSGDLDVAVGTGSVLGTRLESVTATFEAQQGNVDVTFDEPVTTLVVATADGDITVQLPDAPYAFETSAPNGTVDILIEVDATAANAVTLDARNGDITVYKR
jgi:DUF4097 and DUF4098 domain-containing protein YvlB